MDDLYTVPTGVDLTSPDVRFALESVFVSATYYLANGALNHVFRDQRTGAKVFVVENEPGTVRRLTEVVGNTGLWGTVRAVALDVARAPALYASKPAPTIDGDTGEQDRRGEVIELAA